MVDRLLQIPYSEPSFEKYKALNAKHRETFTRADLPGNAEKRIGCAVAWYVRNKMSRGGLGRDFAWSDRLRGGQPGDLNAWQNSIRLIPRVSARLQGVSHTCRHFRDALRWMPAGRVCIYADPPYLHSTRTVTTAYEIEMSDQEHLELLTLLSLKAMEGHVVLLSGYANAMYDGALRGWQRTKFSMPNHSGQGKTKQRRTEVLWVSPKAWR
jgi:DNA adenine methylase